MASRLSDCWPALAPDPYWLGIAILTDLAIGDPSYAWHPIRIVGRVLTWMEALLRTAGFNGYGGGVLLFVGLSSVSLVTVTAMAIAAAAMSAVAPVIVHLFVLYSLLALGDLLRHVWEIERAVRAGDLPVAQAAVSVLVGRDTDRMDGGACRRAAVESLSENLTDGFVSPVFWYMVAGIPGLVLFKVVSTMDSMVGYKTPRYLQFGWCGARLDDVMNYLPARLTWIALSVLAAFLPGYSGRKAWTVGLEQHALLLGPNSGWSEAATAGALQRRIVGPIFLKGEQVTDLWIGAPNDPPLDAAGDVIRAMALAVICGVMLAVGAAPVIISVWHR